MRWSRVRSALFVTSWSPISAPLLQGTHTFPLEPVPDEVENRTDHLSSFNMDKSNMTKISFLWIVRAMIKRHKNKRMLPAFPPDVQSGVCKSVQYDIPQEDAKWSCIFGGHMIQSAHLPLQGACLDTHFRYPFSVIVDSFLVSSMNTREGFINLQILHLDDWVRSQKYQQFHLIVKGMPRFVVYCKDQWIQQWIFDQFGQGFTLRSLHTYSSSLWAT